MFLYLSKLLPLLMYPLGLACLLLILALAIRRHSAWQTTTVLLALVLLWLGSNRLVSMVLVRSLEWRYLPPQPMPQAEVIVVLGGGTRPQTDPRPIPEINEAGDRLLYAAHLYHQGAAPRVLVTGGQAVIGPQEVSEAQAMRSILAALEVPDEAILVEGQSQNTYENATLSVPILQDEGVKRVLLVTSALHMPRSVRIFRQFDLEVIPAPTDFHVTRLDWDYYTQPDLKIQAYNLLPNAEELNWTTRALKEYIGIAVYRLRGWL